MNATRPTTTRILKDTILVKMLLDFMIWNLKMHIFQLEKTEKAKFLPVFEAVRLKL